MLLDISKTFNKIFHKNLKEWKKLEEWNLGYITVTLINIFNILKTKNSYKGPKIVLHRGNCRRSQDSLLGPLLFIIYIYDLSGSLKSLVSVVKDIKILQNELSVGLTKINNWKHIKTKHINGKLGV